tara:strand:- start:201 stop:494 length:294 start_codon:yes stop_codon:yes gene_type:complete
MGNIQDRETKMKITKRQLQRIIKEEKQKLINEMNPDGTVSADEDDLEDDLMMDIEMEIDRLIQNIRIQAEEIGGGFRGPGIRARALKLLADKIYNAR